MGMIYTLQVTEPGQHRMNIDLTTSNKKRVTDRIHEVTKRGQQVRVRDSTGHILDVEEILELDR